MENFQDSIRVELSGKTHIAILAFLKRYGADSHDLSRFIEDAVTWRMIDREMAFRHAKPGDDISLFQRPSYEEHSDRELI